MSKLRLRSPMKKNILILVLVLALGGAAAGYWWITKPESVSVAISDLVPESAVLVYQSKNLVEDWDVFSQHALGKALSSTPAMEAIGEGLRVLDSAGESNSFARAWLRSPTMISLHVTGRSGFDFVFYAQQTGKTQRLALKGIHQYFASQPNIRYKKREYEGRTIHQFQDKERAISFYYYQEDEHLIGSFTGYLLEDVIRHAANGATGHFFAQHPELEIDEGGNDGRWWINLHRWPQLMETFLPANEQPIWDAFGDFLQMDWVLGEDVVLWSGIAPQGVAKEPKEFLDVLQTQENGKFRLPAQLPARTAWAFHWQMNAPVAYQAELYRYQQLTAGDINQQREAFADRFLLDFEGLTEDLGPEAAMVVLESVNLASPDRLVILQSRAINKSLAWLKNLSAKVSETTLDSLYLEEYLGQEIRLADVYNFPAFAFGKQLEGFSQCFYSSYNDYLILGNSAQGVRRVLEDWSSGQVLGKSVRAAMFLENTLEEGVCGWVFQSPRAWNHLLPQVNTEWQAYFGKEGLPWRGIGNGALQFRKEDKKWFSFFALQPEQGSVAPEDRRFDTHLSTQFEHPISSPPFVVRNHMDGSRETLLQDELGNLMLLDAQGQMLWSDSLGELMVSDVKQVDYYGNGKLQYFVATSTQVHIIDREGNPLQGFPVQLPEGEVLIHASVIDYDGSKRYRFALSTRSGKVYLLDKNGFQLEGWNPRVFGAALAQPPLHVRVRGIDRLVFLQEDGLVVVTNRRGEVQDGFPMDLKGVVNSPLFIEEGTGLDNSFFYAVTQDGELVTFTMEGKVAERQQLYKPTRHTKFALVPDVLGQTFLISRISEGQIGFLDAKGQDLFEKEFLISGQTYSQFYRFGAGREVILVTDLQQEFSYVFDYNGNLVNYRPLENANKAGVLYYENSNTFYVYTAFGSEYAISTFQP